MSNTDPAAYAAALISNPMAPDMFADEAVGFLIRNGVVSITLAAQRPDHKNSTPNRVVVANIVLPVSAAQALAVGLYDFLKRHGFEPAAKPDASKVQ